jgi:hypothetical protein
MFVATIDVNGAPRTFASATCDDLIAAVAISLAIALDPARFAPPEPKVDDAPEERAPSHADLLEPARPGPVTAVALRESSDLPVEPERRPLVWSLGTHVGGAFGEAPAPAVAVSAWLGVRRGWGSLNLEGRLDLPASASADKGTVSATSSRIALVPCLHWRALGGCAVVSAGLLYGKSTGVEAPSSDSSFVATAGLRAFGEWPVTSSLALRGGFDVTSPMHGARLVVQGREAWATPPVAALLWAGGAVHFP